MTLAMSSLSSTTSKRERGCSVPGAFACGGGSTTGGGTSAAGSRTVNSLPFPRPSLAAVDAPAVEFGETPDEREPDPQAPAGAVERVVHLGEQVEDLGQHLGIDPDSGIANGDAQLFPLAAGPRPRSGPPGRYTSQRCSAD